MKSIGESYKQIRLIEENELHWFDLFLDYPFFHDYEDFIEIEILSSEINQFYRWSGLVKARLRYFYQSLEKQLDGKIIIHPWPSEFLVNFKDEPIFKYASFFYIG